MVLEIIAKIGENINSFADFVVSSLAGLVVVGTLAMSIVQALKNIPGISARDKFFRSQFVAFLKARHIDANNLHEMESLIYKHVSGGKEEFYAQKLDSLVQSLNTFKNVAVANPTQPDFREFLNLFDKDTTDELIKANANDKKPLTAFMNQLITGHLTGFETRVQRLWSSCLHGVAIIISCGLIIYFGPFDNFLYGLLYGVLGGFIAPFAHNIVKVVKPS